MSTQSDDPADSCHVDTVLGSVIQPLLQACRMGGQALSKGDMALFMLNNVSAIRVCGVCVGLYVFMCVGKNVCMSMRVCECVYVCAFVCVCEPIFESTNINQNHALYYPNTHEIYI